MEVFDDTFIPPGLGEWWFASRKCPVCVGGVLHPVRSFDASHWLCETCGHCWRAEHGHLRRVDPVSCRGCVARSKRECVTLLSSEFPRFGPNIDTDDEGFV